MQIQSFKDLTVWQKSMDLVKEIYAITSELPRTEDFGLTSQMRKSSMSIPSNVAEGRKRSTRKDFVQFLRIASGSAAELETQLILVRELYPHISSEKAAKLLTEVQKMLSVMVKKLLVSSSSKLQAIT